MDRIPESLRTLWPHMPCWHQTDAGRMHYVDLGPRDARPVLLVHGNPSWGFLWRNLAAELVTRGRRVIIPDHVGMGLSDRPGRIIRLSDRIRHLRELCDKLNLQEIDLGVHDWGGAIGLGLASEQPQRFRRLLVTNTAAFPSNKIPLRIRLCRLPVIGRFLVEHLDGFAWPATWMATSDGLPASVRAGFLAPYTTAARRHAVADFVADIPLEKDHPTYASLQKVSEQLPQLSQHSILLLWGARDFCFTPHFHDIFQKIWPHAQSCVFESAGHYVLEDAGENGLKKAANFLAA
ncbi:MAG TPA: alpha/beta hydrolase [Opitutae bacterium]|nr:alpha/beta hydrolase [Opitutae bacterium]